MTNIKKYIDKNGKPRYEFQIYLGIDSQTGKKKKTRRRGFKTKNEATIALSRITYNLKTKGSIPTENNILFKSVYDEWYAEYINTVRESTWARTEGMFNNHILPYLVISALELSQLLNANQRLISGLKRPHAIISVGITTW